VAKKGAKGPIFEGETPLLKSDPKSWRQYWRHNRNPVNGMEGCYKINQALADRGLKLRATRSNQLEITNIETADGSSL
jgi:hypothetical protein